MQKVHGCAAVFDRQRGRGEIHRLSRKIARGSFPRLDAAYSGVFPGYTLNQIIQLNDAAFDSNKVAQKFSAIR